MILRIMLVLILVLSVSIAVADNTSDSVDATADCIKMVLSLPKKVYIDGEPIIASATIVNQSSKEEYLAEPSTPSNLVAETIEFQTKVISTASKLPVEKCRSVPGPPSDYYWKFAPGASRTASYNLHSGFFSMLPVGEYKVKAVYVADDSITGVWHGIISTPYLEFSIVAPSGDDVKVAKAFKDAYAQSKSKKTAIEAAGTLELMRDEKVGRRFSLYAGFNAACARYAADDKDGYIADLETYIKDHPNVPHYSEHSRRLLGRAYYDAGKYDAARAAFAKLPDSYEKNYWIKECEDKIESSRQK